VQIAATNGQVGLWNLIGTTVDASRYFSFIKPSCGEGLLETSVLHTPRWFLTCPSGQLLMLGLDRTLIRNRSSILKYPLLLSLKTLFPGVAACEMVDDFQTPLFVGASGYCVCISSKSSSSKLLCVPSTSWGFSLLDRFTRLSGFLVDVFVDSVVVGALRSSILRVET